MAALRSPPHNTLHMPFAKPEKFEGKMKEKLSEFCQNFDPFEIEMKDFGCFKSRVIFVNVVVNEILQKLQNTLTNLARTELGIFYADFKGLPFHPHVTIAFRDLSKANFSKAWKHFQNVAFHGIDPCISIALLKHNGKVGTLTHPSPSANKVWISAFEGKPYPKYLFELNFVFLPDDNIIFNYVKFYVLIINKLG